MQLILTNYKLDHTNFKLFIVSLSQVQTSIVIQHQCRNLKMYSGRKQLSHSYYPLHLLVLLATSDLNINCCLLLIMKRFLEAVLLLGRYFTISRFLSGIYKWVCFYKGHLHIGSRFFLAYLLENPLHLCPAKCDIAIRRFEKKKKIK